MLILQESFVIIRRKKMDCDGRGTRGFKGGAWHELVGLLCVGSGNVELGKHHLAHKLDVRFTHTY